MANPIDYARPIKAICIGAGMSGIQTGVRFPQKIKNLELVIYEKNAEVGGTWFENKYPGLACDIPSPAYQYTYASNPDWSRFYASGPEIQSYLKDVARKYDVYKYCKFGHMFKSAEWLAEPGKWKVTLERMSDGKIIVDTSDVLIKATGLLNSWSWPKFPGLDKFKGKLIHSADWDTSFDVSNKTVAVIGYGSSALQIVPTIQPIVKRMDHYVRGKSWISPNGPGADEVKARGGLDNFDHSPEERAEFSNCPDKYLEFRHRIESQINRAQTVTWRGTPANKAFSDATDNSMRERLLDKPEIYKSLRPDYPVACRRISPGPRYLEALTKENVVFIPKEIARITENGIVDEDGVERAVDAIICATGFDTALGVHDSFITGLNGKTLAEVFDPEPIAYYSTSPASMPNLYLYLGPNGAPGAGSTLHMIEFACDYMISCIQKLQREGLKSMVVSSRASKAWMKQVDRYFAKTTFTFTCKSWAKANKPNGRVMAIWPGSSVHAHVAFSHPRWEDYEYEYLDATWEKEGDEDFLSWMGNGLTASQEVEGKTTWYLDERNAHEERGGVLKREELSWGTNKVGAEA